MPHTILKILKKTLQKLKIISLDEKGFFLNYFIEKVYENI